jgi:lipopolysaccharide/colanic/teichoic acid biosynthesis glycosyltransferase
MSSTNLSIPSSIQGTISSPGECVSAPNEASRNVEHRATQTVKVTNDLIQPAASDRSIENVSTGRLSACTVDDLRGKSPKDPGWWLILDMFVCQKKWLQLATLDASTIMIDSQEQQSGGVQLKRCIDVIVALVLLIVLMPILIIAATLIRLESAGPALFRHSRVGKGGKKFVLWKLRSMRTDTLKYERSPTSSVDSRLTRIGRAIRRVSLDEIPQLLNVLKGEMSLVGPRPEMAFIVNQYTSLERGRLVVKPGITGLWQISSGRAAPIHHNLQYDLYYIRNMSVLLDIAILLRTISAVIRGIGAI